MNKINLITPEDIAAFDRIDRDCLKMHVCPPPKTFINMKVHMPNGELVSELNMVSRSWVRAMYNIAFGLLCSAKTIGATYEEGCLATKDILDSVKTSPTVPIGVYYSSGINDLAVGTGSAGESFEGYVLGTRIADGNGATQLMHSSVVHSLPTYASGTKKWSKVTSRIFNNNSGAQIDVTECGLYGQYQFGSSNYNFMTCRDLLASPVAVANTAQLTVTYTMEMTFPA